MIVKRGSLHGFTKTLYYFIHEHGYYILYQFAALLRYKPVSYITYSIPLSHVATPVIMTYPTEAYCSAKEFITSNELTVYILHTIIGYCLHKDIVQ